MFRKKLNVFRLSLIMVVALISVDLAASSTGGAQIILEKPGLKVLKINDPSYDEIFEKEVMVPSAKIINNSSSSTASQKTNEVVVVSSLRGVLDADLPSWVEEEFLEEQGFDNWSLVSEEELDKPIETTTIDMDSVEKINDISESNAVNNNYDPSIQYGIFSFLCSKRWSNRSKYFNKNIKEINKELIGYNKNGVSANLNAVFDGSGVMSAKLNYQIRKRCDIPYKARIVDSTVDVDLKIDGEMSLTGSAIYEIKKKIFNKSIKLFHYEQNWWVYVFEFELELDADIDFGVDIEVNANASFDTVHDIKGDVKVSWLCTTDCKKTRDETKIDFHYQEKMDYQAEIKIDIIPYADLNFSADFDLYYGLVQLAKAKVGVVVALPISFYGYYGNLCSDANGDGVNEQVRGLLLDVRKEIYVYLKVKLFSGSSKYYALDLPLDSWDFYEKTDGLYTEQGFTATVYRDSLIFKDLLSPNSSVLDAVIKVPAVIKQDGKLTVGPRDCYPFGDTLTTYEIDWGDGSPNYVGFGGDVSHKWLFEGPVVIRARMVSDEVDRTFDASWTQKEVTVSKTGSVSSPDSGFLISTAKADQGADYNQTCIAEFGTDARIADWNDLVAYHSSGSDLSKVVSESGITSSNRDFWVTRSGRSQNYGRRDYFISYHNHNKPSHYGAHANLDNYFFSLGSWWGARSVLCFNASDSTEVDIDPDNFDFEMKLNVEKSTMVEFSAVQVKGINTPISISILSGTTEYSINGGAWTAVNGLIGNGDKLSVRHKSSDRDNAYRQSRIKVGDLYKFFSSKTKEVSVPELPDNHFVISTAKANQGADYNQACINEFGASARIADWNDLVAYQSSGKDLNKIVSESGMTSSNRDFWVTRNGSSTRSGKRDYFISYHNHNKPRNYGAHAHLDNYFFSLGSWWGARPVLCYRES